jgi:ubiquinone biosynthesis monooxygenase Coq7
VPKPEFRQAKAVTDSIIRVNHAGEYGAVRIYQGQLDASKNSGTKALISHMLDQEQKHLAFFENAMKQRSTRPTILMPLWHYGAYFLGFITAKMGAKTAMLCTQAVEEVIDEHYAQQIHDLQNNESEPELLSKIEQFRQEELEHKDAAIDHGSMEAPLYFCIRKVIGSICKAAIELSKK